MKKINLKMLSVKFWPLCTECNVLNTIVFAMIQNLAYFIVIIPPPNEVGVYWNHLVRSSVCSSVSPSVCRRHGFRSISQVCCGISISNFIYMLMVVIGRSLLIFSCDCLPFTPFRLCSHNRIIMKFSGVITNDQSKVHAKGQGQRSKVKVTEVTT